MTLAELVAELQAASDEWTNGLRAPTEAFRDRMDAALDKAQNAGLSKEEFQAALVGFMITIEPKLHKAFSEAMRTETITAVLKDRT